MTNARGVALVLLAVQAAFASLAIVGKVTLGVVPWPAIVLLRSAGALAVFAAAAAIRGESLLPPRGVRGRAALLGFLGVFANQSAFLAGLRRTTAINATVLIATIPLFTTLASVALGRDKPTPRFAAGTLVALAGMLAVVNPFRTSFGGSHAAGDLLVLLNSASYGLYLALAPPIAVAHGAGALVRWAFLAGTVLALPAGVPSLATAAPGFDARVWMALAYVVLVPTAFAYAANAWALRRVPPSVVSVFIYLQPVLATAFALAAGAPLARWLRVPFVAEALTARTVAGALLVLAGVTLAQRRTDRS